MTFDGGGLLKKLQDDLARSPHACEDCGTKLLRAGVCCDCEEKRRRERELRGQIRESLQSVQERYQWATFDAPELHGRVENHGAIAKARAAAVPTIRWVTLVGSAGTGKSILSVCIMRALERRLRGLFATAIDLSNARASSRLGHEAALVDEALRAELLVVDDLGAETAGRPGALTDVMNDRHGRCRATIVSTGFPEAAVLARYGAGIHRRLFEGAVVIETDGPKKAR
jgi:DNA replication protein DnaC